MMEIVPAERFPRRDRAGLKAFLEYCREQARQAGSPRLVSISLEVRHIDPLAVLEAIYEPGERHFYLEQTAAEEGLAGAEAIIEGTFDGPERFRAVEAFRAEAVRRTIAIGDAQAPFFGPHFFCGFTFFDEVEHKGDGAPAFAPATVFLPRWQVGFKDGRYGAVANLGVSAETDLEPLVEKVWRAHARFAAFPYGPSETAPGLPANASVQRTDFVDTQAYAAMVADALERIEAGAYAKIVLARAVDLEQSGAYRPLRLLNALRQRYPTCHCFSLANGQGQSFVGATPEELARATGGQLTTEALAGSAPRGTTAGDDAALGMALLESGKDLREHSLVVDSIERRLRSVGLQPKRDAERPRLTRLANVQHLRTRLSAALKAEVPFLTAVAALHPTPALGGTPRGPALEDIARLEPFARGLFGGLIGWLGPRGDTGLMTVGIRSGLVDGSRARLYAGAGIVAGSDPQREAAETELKLSALLGSFA
ncbi:MAG: isochorismate synthase MenF [Opitutales bacterium]